MQAGGGALRLIRIAGTAMVVLFVAFQLVNPRRPVGVNTPGFRDPVLGFELASRPEDVFGILGAPGDPARAGAVSGMQRGLYLDFVFLLAYSTFYAAIASLLAARGALARGL